MDRGEQGRLRVGFVGVATHLGAPELLRRFRDKHPRVHLQLEEKPNSALEADLASGALDVAFLRGIRPPEAPLRGGVLARDRYALVLPAEHELADDEGPVKLSVLDGLPLLFFPRALNPTLHDAWMATFSTARVQPRLVQEIRSVTAEAALVRVGLGAALAPWSAAPRRGVVVRRLQGATPPIIISLAWHPERETPALHRLLDVAFVQGTDVPGLMR